MKKTGLIVLIIIGLIIVGLFLKFIILKSKTIASKAQNYVEEKIIPVTVEEIKLQPFTSKINSVGVATPKEDYIISAKVSGEVTFLNNIIGANVAKDNVVVEIDKDVVQAAFNQAEANYKLAFNNYLRQKNLLSQNLIPTQQFEVADAQYRVAMSNLKMAKINLQNAQVVSPINGTLAEIFTNLYEFAMPGKQLFRVVNEDIMEIKIGLSEESIIKIQKGNVAILKFGAFGDRQFQGRVTQIGSQTNDSKTFPVIIELNNLDGLIKGGMIADVTVIFETNYNALVIPFYLVQKSMDRYYVFLERDGFALIKEIRISEIQGDIAKVSEGLALGDRLILEGYKYVVDGSKVLVK